MNDLDQLSVGYEKVRAAVDELLRSLAAKGRCAPLFVSGEWGTGKSHMLEFIRGAALRRGIAQVRIDLNARGAPLNYPQRFYPSIAESVCLSGARGVRSILEDAFASRQRRDALLQYAWADESGVLGAALRSIVLDSRELGSDVLVDHAAWDVVLGTDLAPFDHKRPQALERLAALAKLLRSIGGSGLVMLFDEAETIDQLWNRISRMGAYHTLGALCRMDAAWAIFGVTERFHDRIQQDLDAGILAYASSGHAESFLDASRNRSYRRIEPPTLSNDHANELARRVIETYTAAYSIGTDDLRKALEVFETWKSNPGRNPRRLIRCIIDALDAQRALMALPTSRSGWLSSG